MLMVEKSLAKLLEISLGRAQAFAQYNKMKISARAFEFELILIPALLVVVVTDEAVAASAVVRRQWRQWRQWTK